MPSICHQCSGVDFFSCVLGVPEHCFLHYDGNNCCPQGKLSGNGELCRIFIKYFFVAIVTNSKGNHSQHCRKDYGGDAFHTLVSVLVLLVGSFVGIAHACHYDKSAEYVGRRMDTVRNHCCGMSYKACEELAYGKEQVANDTIDGNNHGSTFFLTVKFHFFTSNT